MRCVAPVLILALTSLAGCSSSESCDGLDAPSPNITIRVLDAATGKGIGGAAVVCKPGQSCDNAFCSSDGTCLQYVYGAATQTVSAPGYQSKEVPIDGGPHERCGTTFSGSRQVEVSVSLTKL